MRYLLMVSTHTFRYRTSRGVKILSKTSKPYNDGFRHGRNLLVYKNYLPTIRLSQAKPPSSNFHAHDLNPRNPTKDGSPKSPLRNSRADLLISRAPQTLGLRTGIASQRICVSVNIGHPDASYDLVENRAEEHPVIPIAMHRENLSSPAGI